MGSIHINISNMNFFMNRIGWGLGLFGGKKTRVVAAAAATAAVVVTAAGFYKRYRIREQLKEHQKRLKQEQESAFEYKYFKEYDELADDPDAPVPALNNHVRDTTPQGDVIMTYDADRAMFCYYCDKRSVQFKYLESVARKYVVEHGCKRLYIDIRKEVTKAHNKSEERQERQEKPNATKSVFAQFKKYGVNPVAKAANAQPVVLKEQVTRYWYCGRLDEFNPHPAADVATTHDFSIIKPIDYASYKKMNSS